MSDMLYLLIVFMYKNLTFTHLPDLAVVY